MGCGPCRMIAPRVEAAVAATNDEVDLAIIDIDELPDLAEAYNVTAIPCLLGVKDGQIMDRLIGGQDEDTISVGQQNQRLNAYTCQYSNSDSRPNLNSSIKLI